MAPESPKKLFILGKGGGGKEKRKGPGYVHYSTKKRSHLSIFLITKEEGKKGRGGGKGRNEGKRKESLIFQGT